MNWISVEDKLPLDLDNASSYDSLQVIVKYMEDYHSEKKLIDIIHLRKIKPIDLVRQGES